MEFIMMNLGIFALMILFMGVSFILPLTIAYVVAVIFMINGGFQGYILAPTTMDAWSLVVLGGIVAYMADVLLWMFKRTRRH